MEFFKPGLLVDFMRHRPIYIGVSSFLVVASLVSLFVPGPNFGIDFAGGTEVQLQFEGDVSSGELRQTLEALGYERPDVVAVVGSPNEYIIRVREVSAIPDSQREAIEQGLRDAIEGGGSSNRIERVAISPGGDKVSLDLGAAVDEAVIRETLEDAGVSVTTVRRFGRESDHRYEAQLEGIAQEMIQQLREAFDERAPGEPRRVEWVGPRAGQQLRDAAIQSLLFAIVLILVYVAFRFDLRYAPGAVVAMAHDAIITAGIFVLLQKEFNLTIIAALLTIVGYSINDTIVVYDRIRENVSRERDKSLYDVINISTSQMLSRTIVTSGTTLLSVSAFFLWGTSVIRDISFALFIGILIGTYSSIYVAAPLTEWMDQRFFRQTKARARAARRTLRAQG
ncbi:MAG: protein translocase subunit SecF [Sandaracinaceae bacterium]